MSVSVVGTLQLQWVSVGSLAYKAVLFVQDDVLCIAYSSIVGTIVISSLLFMNTTMH